MGYQKRHSLAIKLVAAAVIGTLIYLPLFLVAYLYAVGLLYKGITPESDSLRYFQKHFYERQLRVVWQSKPECVALSPTLIYVPRNGNCRFENLEFSTTLSFDAKGRAVPARDINGEPKSGVALLGDSYTMGWGVNDEDTYANILQRNLKVPVYNLGVSSYGTARELRHFMESGLSDAVETVIIQYTGNDLSENKSLKTHDDYKREFAKFDSRLSRHSRHGPLSWAAPAVTALNAVLDYPKQLFRDMFKGIGPEPLEVHPLEFAKVISSHLELLSGKRLIVVVVDDMKVTQNLYDAFRAANLEGVELAYVDWEMEDFFPVDGHLNKKGHEKMATALAKTIKTVQHQRKL